MSGSSRGAVAGSGAFRRVGVSLRGVLITTGVNNRTAAAAGDPAAVGLAKPAWQDGREPKLGGNAMLRDSIHRIVLGILAALPLAASPLSATGARAADDQIARGKYLVT